MSTMGLVKVTIEAPQRRIDLALPERATLAEILPGLLAHAGEGLPDAGARTGGWVLRHGDGTPLDISSTLGAHRVRDGAVLHLVPHQISWPELEYDDLVDAIAGGARRGRLWGPRHTRLAGLAVAGLALLLALPALLRGGATGAPEAWTAIVIAAVLLLAGGALARALADAGAGALLGAVALPYAFTGGGLLLAGGHALTDLGAPALIAGCAAVLMAAAIAHVVIVDRAELFTAAAAAALLGGAAAWLSTLDSLNPTDAAAAVAVVVLVSHALLGPLSVRLGRVPVPVLPRTAGDLVRDAPQPARLAVDAAVRRADAILTGLVGGGALVAALASVVLARSGEPAAIALAVILTLGYALRARLYPAVRQRLPLLAVAVTGAAALLLGALTAEPAAVPVAVALVGAGAAALAGLSFSRRAPGAYLGRYAELAETMLTLSCVPLLCGVLGLYGVVRGLGG